jgi:hypothetical protein
MTPTTIPPPSPNADEQGTLPVHCEQALNSRSSSRRYAGASFDNLVVLANYEEHLREARKMVWRDRGEPAVEVHDLWECFEHGFRGGLRTSQPLLPSLEGRRASLFRSRDSCLYDSLWRQSHPPLCTCPGCPAGAQVCSGTSVIIFMPY